jgi:hypothetical protein
MLKINLISWSVLLVVAFMLMALLAPIESHATIIIRSKSNIANNRQIPGQASGPGNVVVFCDSCTYAGLPEEGHLILMDNETGDIFAYSDSAMVGKEDPVYVGTISAVGKRIIKKSPAPKP